MIYRFGGINQLKLNKSYAFILCILLLKERHSVPFFIDYAAETAVEWICQKFIVTTSSVQIVSSRNLEKYSCLFAQ